MSDKSLNIEVTSEGIIFPDEIDQTHDTLTEFFEGLKDNAGIELKTPDGSGDDLDLNQRVLFYSLCG